MELEEQSGIDTWRGAAEGGTFLLWRSSMPAAGGGAFLAVGERVWAAIRDFLRG